MPKCSACGVDVTWIKPKSGKNHPLQHGVKKMWTMSAGGWELVDVWGSHYDHCDMRVKTEGDNNESSNS